MKAFGTPKLANIVNIGYKSTSEWAGEIEDFLSLVQEGVFDYIRTTCTACKCEKQEKIEYV